MGGVALTVKSGEFLGNIAPVKRLPTYKPADPISLLCCCNANQLAANPHTMYHRLSEAPSMLRAVSRQFTHRWSSRATSRRSVGGFRRWSSMVVGIVARCSMLLPLAPLLTTMVCALLQYGG